MKTRVIISDIHGCYFTMLRLLDRCPVDCDIAFAGDLIDRGPHSREVLIFAHQNAIPTVAGNHEDMMLDHLGLPSVGYEDGCWLANGGVSTLQSFGGTIPAAAAEWVASLPLQLDYGELHVSHTGVGICQDRATSLWARDIAFPSDGRFRVFGHTPSKFAILGENFARIDTGAAYGKQGFGTLTALIWPTMRVVQQAFDESPYELKRRDLESIATLRTAA